VIATRTADGKAMDVEWLEPELRRILLRSQLHIAAVGGRVASESANEPYLLRVALAPDGQQASLALAAPDQVLEREQSIVLEDSSRLGIARTLAGRLPQFLDAPGAASDWEALLGVSNAAAYAAFTSAANDILGPHSGGFTRPPNTPARTRIVERLERLVRSQPRFARARALLALGYLSLGGVDEASLTQLAATNAERALALDVSLADAHAALGLAALRHNEWIAAREHLENALAADLNSAPALEGLACLLTDAGLYQAARPIAERAAALQPRSVGANECLAYVVDDHTPPGDGVAAVQVAALKMILDANPEGAGRLLRENLRPAQFEIWAQPLLRALASPRQTPDALRAITRAASDDQIDASTEILCGAALKQADFVLNRMARLQRHNAHTPLRILWLPQAAFLRRHARFEDVISAAGLPAFWQEHGAPDICATEPNIFGCREKPPRSSRKERKKE
jgi:tetratricopeptide (TPR) repeat protein